MSNKVCYITKDDFVLNFANKAKPQYTYDISPRCIINSALNRMSGDSFADEVPDGQVVVATSEYDNNVYQTTIETVREGEYSQCDGPDSIRGITSYYIVTAGGLEECSSPQNSILGTISYCVGALAEYLYPSE